MVSRDPLTEDWYCNKWDACVYIFYTLLAYSLLLFLFVIEVQNKSFICFGRYKYWSLNNAAWSRGGQETGKTAVKGANSLLQWNRISIDEKKISTNTLYSEWKPDALLSLIEVSRKDHTNNC